MVGDGDAARAVLDAFDVRRAPRLVRRFEHGVGGACLIELDGSACVLKAWPQRSGDQDHLEHARLEHSLELAEIARSRGVPVPALVEQGRTGSYGYLVYEFVDGEWSDQLGPESLADLLHVLDTLRDAAPSANGSWVDELQTMLSVGDPTFDIAPDALHGSTEAEAALTEARRRLAVCQRASMRTRDIVHGDFAPENLLVRDGRVVGVVDWERARIGDGGIDLVGAIFDLEIGEKAPSPLRDGIWSSAQAMMTPDVLSAYVGLYAVRYLSWSVGTEMEDEVLDLVHRLLGRTEVRAST